MVCVGREEFDESGSRMGAIADGNVEFVGGDDAEGGVAELPPKLMTDSGDIEGVRGRNRVLNGLNDTSGGKEKDQDDEHGHNGPSQFHLVAAVNLRRLAIITCGMVAKSNYGIDQKRKDYNKNQAGNDENEKGQAADGIGRCGDGVENVGNSGGPLSESKRSGERKECSGKKQETSMP